MTDAIPIADSSSSDATRRWRWLLFTMGDCAFLVAVGVATLLVVHEMHELQWPIWIACPLGMIAAMVLQMVMAFCVSPLLGSIEAMTPSMVLGMLAPMPFCALHIVGCETTHSAAVMWGVGTGFVMYAFVLSYSTICERRFRTMIERNRHGITNLGSARSNL